MKEGCFGVCHHFHCHALVNYCTNCRNKMFLFRSLAYCRYISSGNEHADCGFSNVPVSDRIVNALVHQCFTHQVLYDSCGCVSVFEFFVGVERLLGVILVRDIHNRVCLSVTVDEQHRHRQQEHH